jgi:Rrf2 family iron-sulfur cluster assembly transcriptional regulator
MITLLAITAELASLTKSFQEVILIKRIFFVRIMRITRRDEYGLKGLLFLAQQPDEKIFLVSEISRGQNIPERFLAKIFQQLSKAGVLRSVRGSKGGFSLKKAAAEITMKEVIEALEGPIAINRCLLRKGECGDEQECPLYGVLEEAQEGLVKVLERTTIEDLVKRIPNGKRGRR